MNNTKIKGLTTELQCQLFFTSLGYNVSVPLGEDCRYDMIVDIDSSLYKIQVKTCHLDGNGIKFSTKSSYMTSDGIVSTGYTINEIDFFATYYDNQCYLIPVEQCGKTSKKLTFEKIINCLYIEDYEATKVIQKIQNGETIRTGGFIVEQYDLQDNLLNTFSSFAEAGQSLGKQSSHINACANGKRKTAYGYKWRVREEI